MEGIHEIERTDLLRVQGHSALEAAQDIQAGLYLHVLEHILGPDRSWR